MGAASRGQLAGEADARHRRVAMSHLSYATPTHSYATPTGGPLAPPLTAEQSNTKRGID